MPSVQHQDDGTIINVMHTWKVAVEKIETKAFEE